ncbi:ABC-2 type transport system ATP-binding protein [Saccharothrix ecbatanensis]|uniref:ABC-2 type transport system ATP-binding protein n=1 Tax=Saccharothrix ecbatanensis TaxID=1105145 RepID=A0A7W9HPA5_9PSEU|nr:ABC transporter ATP-binding protein [Saccharothrix ecbatanensis]MBB5805939.1 ABC-2 type transport system ATP-binding protein [Saccharothrix ecbatanensis]
MTTVVDSVGSVGDTAIAVRAQALGKRYRSKWALRECTFDLPEGRVAALVGANGAGKTTLMTVLAGLLDADEGSAGAAGRVAFVSQEKPVYRHFSAADMLRLGAHLNVVWDETRARRWLARFEIPLDKACGKLSGGMQAQVAFALAIGSRPSVLMLDEPLANLDPLARREVTAELLSEVAETGMTVLLSTHVVAELAGVADYLLLLAHGRLLAGGDLDDLLARHVGYTGPRSDVPPVRGTVVDARHNDTQSSFVVELAEGQPRHVVGGQWSQRSLTLEEYVLAQLEATRKGTGA